MLQNANHPRLAGMIMNATPNSSNAWGTSSQAQSDGLRYSGQGTRVAVAGDGITLLLIFDGFSLLLRLVVVALIGLLGTSPAQRIACEWLEPDC
ncbi:hypothetical protein JI739_02705 [Ramlibacter sp. AW1]|uniref:Uncharacterized protein n=1 Tax=Ramlibacter aurantiacus TaxID=2801330 RepID=A0A936ZRB6_9BURK|nr:hypothetical protein [Ramlibacter aurantiacus]MBL0419249.1 hypothetical protein [Ramlibacter aurantiacus]